VQSIPEGVAFRATQVIDAMNRCVPLEGALVIGGGMSQTPYFVQFPANVSGREIRPASMPELTSLGTVKLASRALGETFATISHFGSVLPEPDVRYPMGRFKQAVAASLNWQTS